MRLVSVPTCYIKQIKCVSLPVADLKTAHRAGFLLVIVKGNNPCIFYPPPMIVEVDPISCRNTRDYYYDINRCLVVDLGLASDRG